MEIPLRLIRDIGAAPIVPEWEIDMYAKTHGRLLPTQGELDVLRCWAVGLTNEMTAETLGLSYETVRNYGRQAKFTLRGKTRAHAVANAIRQGLI